MDIFLLYLWTRLDGIQFVFNTLFIAGVLVMAVSAFIAAGNSGIDDNKAEAGKKILVKTAKAVLILMLVGIVVPSQKDAAIIAGGWAAKEIATSDKAQEIGSKTFQLINGKLDEELAKLSKEEK